MRKGSRVEKGADRAPIVSLLAERFDGFFDRGMYPAMAFGSLLVWIWMGLTEGYPAFLDGNIDLVSVVVVLGSFAASLALVGFNARVQRCSARPAVWAILGLLAGGGCLFLLALYFSIVPVPEAAVLPATRIVMVPIGAAAAVLVMVCAAGYACLQPMSAAIAFTFSIMVAFALFFCLNTLEPPMRGSLFSLLPVLASVALLRGRAPLVARLELKPPEPMPYARGFKSMCLAFAVFFFAIGARCAFEPVEKFARAADTSMVGILVVSLAFLWAIGLRRRPVGVFTALKNSYTGAVATLTICLALAPLSIEPFIGIVYNVDVVVMIMELWLITTFVASFNEAPLGHVVALAIGASVVGMAIGWVTGTFLYQALGHDRSYPNIGIACAVAVFSTVGFSGRCFPYLTNHGVGAQKAAKAATPYLPSMYCDEATADFGLSGREREVLELMVVGYGAEAIAEKLFVSYHTARTHIRNIYRKMDVHSQRDLRDDFEASRERYEERAQKAA